MNKKEQRRKLKRTLVKEQKPFDIWIVFHVCFIVRVYNLKGCETSYANVANFYSASCLIESKATRKKETKKIK